MLLSKIFPSFLRTTAVSTNLGLLCRVLSVSYRHNSSTASGNDDSNLNSFIKQLQNRHLRKYYNKRQFTEPSPVTNTVERPAEPARISKTRISEDPECDSEILKSLKFGGDAALKTFDKYVQVSRYPRKKTIKNILVVLSSESNISGIKHVQNIAENVFPKEYLWQMGYNYYLAEALWKSGNVKEAVTIFQNLLSPECTQKKKTSDMLTFFMRYLIKNNMNEEIDLLIESAITCGKNNFINPAANIWQQLLYSESSFHNTKATELLKQLTEIRPYVVAKSRTIVVSAVKTGDVLILHRLLEAILILQERTLYTLLYSMLLEFYCISHNVVMAEETIKNALEVGALVDGRAWYRYKLLLSYLKHEIPLNFAEIYMHKLKNRPQAPVILV